MVEPREERGEPRRRSHGRVRRHAAAAPPRTSSQQGAGNAATVESRFALVDVNDGRSVHVLREGINSCGRSSCEARIQIPDDTVSRVHAEIDVHGNHVELRDLNAHNGTFVNGERIVTRSLKLGDEITFGSQVLRLARADRRPDCDRAERNGCITQLNGRERSLRSTEPASLESAQLVWLEPRGQRADAPMWDSGGAADSGVFNTGSFGVDARRRFAATISELGHFLVTNHAEEHVHANCLTPVARLFKFRMAALLLLDDAGQLETRCIFPPSAPDRALEVSMSLVERVVRERRALLVRDASRGRLLQSARSKGIHSALLAPLFENDDVLGVLYLDQDDPRRPFEKRHLHRLQLLANLVAAKVVQTRVRHEMEWAGHIQRTLLCHDPKPPPGYDVAFKLEPCVDVGGDFYEALPLPDGRYLIALGDIAGHGVGAALFMATILASIRALAHAAASPLGLAVRLAQLVEEQVRPQGFFTLFIGFVEPKTHTLRYVSAGHEPPALFVPGERVVEIDSTGPPIGMAIPVPLEERVLSLPPGALFCVWSDGIPEALRRCAKPAIDFSRRRVLEDLDDLRERPPDEIVRRIFGQVDLFVNCAHAQDDRTMVVLKRRDAETRSAAPSDEVQRNERASPRDGKRTHSA